jgi:hypothetical protein
MRQREQRLEMERRAREQQEVEAVRGKSARLYFEMCVCCWDFR